MKWLRLMRLRAKIASLEHAVNFHRVQAQYHDEQYRAAMMALRTSRADLACIDCPAGALIEIITRRR